MRHALPLVLLVVLLCGVTAVPAPAQTVDFSQPPAAGLQFKVTEKTSGRTQSTITVSDQEPREREQTVKSTSVYTQSVLEVKEGKITRIEREYEDASSTVENSRMTEPRENESPLAWKRIRATWTDEGCKIELREDDAWTSPKDRLKRRVRPAQLRSPLIPLPAESKDVGDTWEFEDETLEKYFGKPRMGRMGRRRGGGDAEGDAIEIERKVSFTLAEITDHREMQCAVITFKLDVKVGDTSTQSTQGTCYYSLKHHIVVGMKANRTSKMEMYREMGERSIEISSEGTSKIEARVELVE